MVKYEIREKFQDKWLLTVGPFESLEKAREKWSQIPPKDLELALVKIEYNETMEHYHSADGKEFW